MSKLVKGNLIRLFKNKVFEFGCVFAMLFTFLWCKEYISILPILMGEPMERMIMCQGAMIFFFSFFVPFFIGVEYTDGIIRNKIIDGHSQKEIFLSDILTLVSGVAFMIVCWLIGGTLAGGLQSLKVIRAGGMAFLYLSTYVTFLSTISFRLQKQVAAIVTCMGTFFILFQSMLLGNLVISKLGFEAEAKDAGLLIYHINVLGQWFSDTHYSFGEFHLATGLRFVAMGYVVVIALVIGMLDLEKRDLK